MEELEVTSATSFVLAQTLKNVGDTHNILGNSQQAITYLEKAIPIFEKEELHRIFEKEGFYSRLANTLYNVGSIYSSQGDYQKAKIHLERALPLFEELGDKAALADTLSILSTLDAGFDFEQDLNYLETALSIYEELDSWSKIAQTFYNIGMLYYNWGEHKKAHPYFERALSIAVEIGDSDQENIIRHRLIEVKAILENQSDNRLHSNDDVSDCQ